MVKLDVMTVFLIYSSEDELSMKPERSGYFRLSFELEQMYDPVMKCFKAYFGLDPSGVS
jgi:hypothetical protein